MLKKIAQLVFLYSISSIAVAGNSGTYVKEYESIDQNDSHHSGMFVVTVKSTRTLHPELSSDVITINCKGDMIRVPAGASAGCYNILRGQTTGINLLPADFKNGSTASIYFNSY